MLSLSHHRPLGGNLASHQPQKLTLVDGKIKRGDTIESWTFAVAGIPEPESAVVTFSLHLDPLSTPPLIELTSEDENNPIVLSVGFDGKLNGAVPRINAPAVGKLVWELQIRVPTIEVAGPPDGTWCRTVFEGTIVATQDGAEREAP